MTKTAPHGTGQGSFDENLEPTGYQEALRAVEAPSALEILEAAGRAVPLLRRELHHTLGDVCDGSFDDHPLIQLFAWKLFSLCFGDPPKWVRPAVWDAKDECNRRSEL